MARFHECIASAKAQGALDDDEARLLASMYDEQLRANAGDHAKARDATVKVLDAEARRKEANARRQADKLAELAVVMDSYRRPTLRGSFVEDPNDVARAILDNKNNRMAGVVGVTNRRDGNMAYGMGQLNRYFEDVQRRSFSITGKRHGAVMLDNMVDEAFGRATGDAAARDFLGAWRKVFDEFVDMFNDAGGAIVKMKDYFPQNHHAVKLITAGKEQWIEFIRPRLDRSKMVDPLSGGPLSEARLLESLDVIYDRIVTDGASDMVADGRPIGRGALANQRQEHRFLVFRDADAWREYHSAFGDGDVFKVLMDHMSGLAKDVAALQELGQNPNLTVEWLKQVVTQETGKDHSKSIGALWTVVNGSQGVGSRAWADGMSAARNFLTAGSLGATTLTAIGSDPFVQGIARFMSGLPVLGYFRDQINQLFSGASRREVLQAGIIWQDMLQHTHRSLQNHNMLSGANVVFGTLADRVLTFSGLNAWTDAGQRAMAQAFMFEAAGHAGRTLDEIAKVDPRFARRLRGQGVRPDDWEIIRAARPQDLGEAGGMLGMMDVLESAPGNVRVREAAIRYAAALHAAAEEGVPRGTAHAQAMMGRDAAPGSPSGEITRTATQFLTFAVTLLSSQLRAAAWELSENGMARGGLFVAGSFTALTLGGIIGEQIREIYLNGRDARPLDAGLVTKGIARGGGLGGFGDFILGDYARGTSQIAGRGIGPVPNVVLEGLSIFAISNRINEDEINAGKRSVDLARRTIPFQNMWMFRPAMERLVWDRLHVLADPNAHRQWRQKERQLMRDYGQGVWWGRGEAEPRRAPDFSTVWQGN